MARQPRAKYLARRCSAPIHSATNPSICSGNWAAACPHAKPRFGARPRSGAKPEIRRDEKPAKSQKSSLLKASKAKASNTNAAGLTQNPHQTSSSRREKAPSKIKGRSAHQHFEEVPREHKRTERNRMEHKGTTQFFYKNEIIPATSFHHPDRKSVV